MTRDGSTEDRLRAQNLIRETEHDQPIRRAAVYARTSTTSQQFGYSIDEQVRLSIERCKSLNWDIAFVHRDEAKSGKNTDRPMFQEMIAQAERGLIDVVVFWKLDRFSRSIMHAVQLEKQFRDWGVALHSVTEQIDTTTAAGQFNFRNLANTAEFEREMIRQRTRMGHAARALEGKWPNGSPPLGYRTKHDGRLQINESEAALIRWLFEEYVETQSMAAVADILNEQDTTADANTTWTPALISKILRNKLYHGCYSVGDIDRTEPGYKIISEQLFERAKEIRTRYQSDGNNSRKPMSERRKERRVNRILGQYQEWSEAL